MARTVKVDLLLDVSQYLRGSKQAQQSTKGLAVQLGEAAAGGDRTARALDHAADDMDDAARAATQLDREIGRLKDSMRQLAIQSALTGDADLTKQLRDQERQLRQLTRSRKLLGDDDATGMGLRVGAKAGVGAAASFIDTFASQTKVLANGPALGAAGAAMAAGAAPLLAAGLSAAVVGGAGIGGVVGGFALAGRDPAVKAATDAMGAQVLTVMTRAASGMRRPMVESIAFVEGQVAGLEPRFTRIFNNSAQLVRPLLEGLASAVDDVTAGVEVMVANAGPAVDVIADGVARLGNAAGDFMTTLADDAEANARALDLMFFSVEFGVRQITMLVDALTEVHSWTQGWTGVLFGGVTALEGFRSKSGEVDRGLQRLDFTTGVVTQSTQELADAAQDQLKVSLQGVGFEMGFAATRADTLRRANDALYDSVMKGADANQDYEASWDALSGAVKRNKGSLDVHTAAGRANRDALKDVIGRTNDLYFAEIATGTSVADATRKHQRRTDAVREEARRLGLNRKATEDLIKVYGRIPTDKNTDLSVTGMGGVLGSLDELYLRQRALATGTTIQAAAAAERRHRASRQRARMATGGQVPGHSPHPRADNIPAMLTAKEWVHPVDAAEYYGPRIMSAVQHKEIPREVLDQAVGYADGGRVQALQGRWPGDFPVRTSVARTRIPSWAEVQSKVTPAFGGWPSSPGAQRGDSGVHRRIHAMVQASGIPNQWGNAYRHGDPLWHGSGRAIDYMGYNQDRLARFFLGMQSKVLELIHTTNQGGYYITRGRRVSSMGRQDALHRNHLHIAMADGGEIQEPVFGVGASGTTYSFGERGPERVIPAGQAAATTVVHNVNVQVSVPPTANPAEVGRVVVDAIRAYEKGSGPGWRN